MSICYQSSRDVERRKSRKKVRTFTGTAQEAFADPGNNRHIPYVLLTNGGGVTEAEKASQISEILGVEVRYLKKLFRMAHDQV